MSEAIKLRTEVPLGNEEHAVVQWWSMFDRGIILGLPSLSQAYGLGTGIKWSMHLAPEEAVALGEALVAYGKLQQAGTEVVFPAQKAKAS